MQKGYIIRRKKGRAFLYKAKIHKDQARNNLLRNLLVNIFDGSESLVVAALLGNRKISEEELTKIRSLINALNQEKGK